MSAKNPNLVRYTVDLEREIVDRFKEHYPHTSISGILSQLFIMFMKEETETMKQQLKSAADNLKEIRR